MIIKTMIRAAIFTSISSLPAFASKHIHTTECFPENDMKIHAKSGFVDTGITEEEFNTSIDLAIETYQGIFNDAGYTLEVARLWDNPRVNASAHRPVNGIMKVSMYGGLARYDGMTSDAFTMVLCHEIGHHLGGAPIKNTSTWPTNEGQADYFAGLKCFRKMFGDSDNISAIADKVVPDSVRNRCEAVFEEQGENRVALCIRSSVAGVLLADVISQLRREPSPPTADTPDQNVVRRTLHSHPASQCRLDTYIEGSFCPVSHEELPSQTDARQGMCNRDTWEIGLRPLCWYKPVEVPGTQSLALAN